ncbi:unnamed protein product [Pleuronectes platessa]|uniref:Uncharacterized protein n=1 Tax=Pleuronectes platessa TaxID=8262 RepID=A0A9N7UN10_PLEPL|nr:unnamed protein product [Pleuronectes platessa]
MQTGSIVGPKRQQKPPKSASLIYAPGVGRIPPTCHPAPLMKHTAASGPGRPIAPLCNTQENLPPAQVQASEKQTPSVTCLLCTGLPGPPSPLLLQSIRPLFSFPLPLSRSLFPFLSLSAPRYLIITGPHSHDLSLYALLKTNRSGLRRGAFGGREGQGIGMVAGQEGREPGEKPTYDEVLCDAEKKKQQRHHGLAVGVLPSL